MTYEISHTTFKKEIWIDHNKRNRSNRFSGRIVQSSSEIIEIDQYTVKYHDLKKTRVYTAKHPKCVCEKCSQEIDSGYYSSSCSLQSNTCGLDDIERILAFGTYYSSIRQRLIKKDQFSEDLLNAKDLPFYLEPLVDLTAKHVKKHYPDIVNNLDALTHVPNLQSEVFYKERELARILSKKLDIPVIYDLFDKTERIDDYKKLGRDTRREKNRAVYTVNIDRLPDTITNLLLVDDTATTGSTLNTLSKKLKQAISPREIHVYGLVIGRSH
ncbi:MAG: ComF family protein [Candidatus Odinarchaeota archaeon]